MFFAAKQPDAVADTENRLNRSNQNLTTWRRFYGKCAGRIDKCVGDDTGQNAAADMEQGGVAEADRGSINKLQQGVQNRLAQQQIDDVSHAEGQGRHDDGGGHIGFAHAFEKESTENHFFQKTHTAHAENKQDGFTCGHVDS